MKRLMLVLLMLGLSSLVRADAGYWVGPKGTYLHPSNQYVKRDFRTFWGGGGEMGRRFRHFEVGLEGNYITARGKDDFEETEAGGVVVGYFWQRLSSFTLMPKIAFHPWIKRTPYLGLGLGYQWSSWTLEGLSHPLPDVPGRTVWVMCTDFFAGYDYRFHRWGGVRVEGAFRRPGEIDNNPHYMLHSYANFRGLTASLETYVAW